MGSVGLEYHLCVSLSLSGLSMLALGLCSDGFVAQSGSLCPKIRISVPVCLKKLPHKLRY